MRHTALLLSLVGLLVGLYAAVVARPQYERARSEWLQVQFADSQYEQVSADRDAHRSHLQMLTLVAAVASAAGLALGFVARRRERTPAVGASILLGVAGAVCAAIAGVAGGLF